jgi:hypothetical protein
LRFLPSTCNLGVGIPVQADRLNALIMRDKSKKDFLRTTRREWPVLIHFMVELVVE